MRNIKRSAQLKPYKSFGLLCIAFGAGLFLLSSQQEHQKLGDLSTTKHGKANIQASAHKNLPSNFWVENQEGLVLRVGEEKKAVSFGEKFEINFSVSPLGNNPKVGAPAAIPIEWLQADHPKGNPDIRNKIFLQLNKRTSDFTVDESGTLFMHNLAPGDYQITGLLYGKGTTSSKEIKTFTEPSLMEAVKQDCTQ